MISMKLPLWLRATLVVGVMILAAGVGLFAYRYYTRPVTLTLAVGSIDGEAAKAMSAIASRLVTTNAPVRLNVIDSGTALAAANAFSAGRVDLAVVRGDVGDLSQARAVIVVTYAVVLIIAPPGSSIDSMDKLKGHTVGVVGGAANSKVVDVLTKEYDLVRAKVVFKDIAPADARQAIQSKSVSALLVAMPLSEKYLSLVRGIFQMGPKMVPVLIPIESAGAIVETERAYESFDIPKGTLRGSPPVPDDDVTTLRAKFYLVANKKLSTDLITSFTQTILSVRRDLVGDQPIFAQITAPSNDQDAYLLRHPGAAGVLAAAWKFLGIGSSKSEGPLDSLYALARRIRKADSEAELSDIEEEIDNILRAERAKSHGGDENEVDAVTLNVAAPRLGRLH